MKKAWETLYLKFKSMYRSTVLNVKHRRTRPRAMNNIDKRVDFVTQNRFSYLWKVSDCHIISFYEICCNYCNIE